MEKIAFSLIIHNNERRVLLTYTKKYYNPLENAIRRYPGRSWSKTYNRWHVPFTNDYISQLCGHFKGIDFEITDITGDFEDVEQQIICEEPDSKEKIIVENITDLGKNVVSSPSGYYESIPLVKYYVDSLRLKNYSPNTIDAYVPYFREFVIHFGEENIDNLTIRQMVDYVYFQIYEHDLTDVPSRHIISAIKFYYEKIKGRDKIYFKFTEKYEISPVDYKIGLEELLPIINAMHKADEKLLILLKYHFGYTTELLVSKKIKQIKDYIQRKTKDSSFSAEILRDIAEEFVESINPRIFLFEKETGTPFLAEELDDYIFSILSKYRVTEIYRYELNDAMKQAGFSDKTRKVYTGCFLSLIKHCDYKNPATITDEEIRDFLVKMKHFAEMSSSYQNQLINAINFYYLQIKGRRISPGTYIRPKREQRMTEVLSLGEIRRMISGTKNKKHRLVLSLLYSLGLRRQELIDLRVDAFDFSRNIVKVKLGKGNKDRHLAIPETIKFMVQDYLKEYNPDKYLIEGADGYEQISATSVANIVHDAAERASIYKRVHPHILRHSITTHLFEQGTDLTFVMEFLGHANAKTTMRYAHLSSNSKQRIKNPIDNLVLGDFD